MINSTERSDILVFNCYLCHVRFLLTCYVCSTKIGEISDISKCFENFVSQTFGVLTRIYAAELRYLANETFQFNGYFLNRDDISRVVIKESDLTSKECSKSANENLPPSVILYISPEDVIQDDEYVRDITKEVFKTSKNEVHKEKTLINMAPNKEFDKTKVFIVHGHDDLAKTEVARFIEKLKLEAIILHEQASSGKTIIEKIEEFSNVGFGLVLYTPCDVGTAKENKDSCAKLLYRARQNVVFEHGYLIGKIGRSNVCALVKGEIETPNDISGVVYIPMNNQKDWQLEVVKELRNSGYDIDMNLII